jgi:hypothetical protein
MSSEHLRLVREAIFGTAVVRANADGTVERVSPLRERLGKPFTSALQRAYREDAAARWRALDAHMTRPFTAADSVRPERLWGEP